MKSTMSYFSTSFIFTLVALVFCYFVAGIEGAFLAGVLGILETSLSMDNAVVNSTVLRDMDQVWRKRFLTWGMVIAVFGMRLVFPVLIVWATSTLGLVESAVLPFKNPHLYETTLTAAHVSIAGFGGTFLLMVFLKFFIDDSKEEHWVPFVESVMVKAGRIEAVQIILALAVAAVVTLLLPAIDKMQFIQSAVWGIIAYLVVDGIGAIFESDETEGSVAASVAKAGIASFLYLEMVDASFSFDGVIGAFAVTNNVILIALGLGIGAMFVRSLTLLMVDKNTLGTFRYLEHGAFWSIGVLAICMFLGIVVDIPEVVTGLSAAVILGLALGHSVYANRKELALAS